MFEFFFSRPDAAQLSRIEASLASLPGKVRASLMDDLSQLKTKLDAVQAETALLKATTKNLAQAVVDLKNAGTSQQGAIDSLTAQAQTILDDLTTTETVGEGALTPETPTPAP
jgi:chromosome segregation ATPase